MGGTYGNTNYISIPRSAVGDMHDGERVCKTYGDAYEKKRNCHAGKSSNQLLVFSTLYIDHTIDRKKVDKSYSAPSIN